MKKFLYFQPEYVREFQCDGAKCNARCCRGWRILIDKETHAQYSQLEDAEKILALMNFNSEHDGYFVALDEKNFCPFLNENNLCRLQLKYGEKSLSETCATYPRKLFDFKKFFERSLTLSCPVAAEIILFRDAPLKFELVEVSEENLCGVKTEISSVEADEDFYEKMFNIQVAAISILQRRTLTIDQRLIALGFFLDKLDEIISDGLVGDALEKLFAAYESESFWTSFSKMSAAVKFNAEKFWELMLKVLVEIYGGQLREADRKFLEPLIETFGIVPDEKNQVFVTKVAANYERLAVARKNFTARHAIIMENFLVNEFFMNVCPWKLKASVAKNFGVFVTNYKLFELLAFAASQKNFNDKALLELTVWFTRQADHEKFFMQKILDAVPDDIFATMETLVETS